MINLEIQQEQDKTNKLEEDNNYKLISFSFYITYVFLLTTGTITFIEAMRTNDTKVRNILNLETCISVVAAYFYGKFVDKINEENIDFNDINDTRYIDWSITTPIMLLVLCLAFLYNNKKGPLDFSVFITIILFNYGMLGAGYMGELGYISKILANTIGFGFFTALYYFIYKMFLSGKYIFDNYLLYFCFLILWSMYGVFYLFGEVEKNVGYNILDLFSKCFVGIFFWAYFTKVFSI